MPIRNFARAAKILEAGMAVAKTPQGRNRIEEIQLHTDGYAEPGYKDPDCCIIATGDYNDISKWDEKLHTSIVLDDAPRRVERALSKMGVECEWLDEWTTCEHCNKLVRTSADSYRWQRAYVYVADLGDVCHECIKSEGDLREDYLLSIEGEDHHCLTLDIDLEANHYKLVEDDFENGFHSGMDASPENIAKLLREVGCQRFLFKLDEVSQFYIGFSVWLHEDENELFETAQEALTIGQTDGPSVSEGLKRGLQAASQQMKERPENADGVLYTKINVDEGTATSRLVRPQEFIDGIKE